MVEDVDLSCKVLWIVAWALVVSCLSRSVPTEPNDSTTIHHSAPPLMMLEPGSQWLSKVQVKSVAAGFEELSDFKKEVFDYEDVCLRHTWCLGMDWVSWSDGDRILFVRAPFGVVFWYSGITNLGGGFHAIGCHPASMRFTDPSLICILELHEEVGMLRINRVAAIPLSEFSTDASDVLSVRRQAETHGPVLGPRIDDDIVVIFGDYAVLASLIEWRPKEPSVCSWGIDYCPERSVEASRFLLRDDWSYSIELRCDESDKNGAEKKDQVWCVTCARPAYGERGTAQEAISVEQEKCSD